MPTVFIQNGYRVSFTVTTWPNVFMHVFKAGAECKVWMDDLTIAFNRGFKAHDIAEIRRFLSDRRAEIVAKWQEHERTSNP